MRLVVVLVRGATVRHLAVEQGTRTRSLCGQVQEHELLPSASTTSTWRVAFDDVGTVSKRPMCQTCVRAWDAEWAPFVAAVRKGKPGRKPE